jgi:osmotically-inducible protein OsmY
MRTTAIFLALGASALSSGCVAVTGAAAVAGGMVAVQDRTIGRSLDDAAASNTVKTRLMALDNAAYMRVDVEMAQGQLLLSGTTPTAEHKAMAERIAWSVAGIDEVANEIEVGRNPGMLRSGLDNFITAQVRTKILADSQIKGVNYNIETQKGVVYLMGLARSEEELQRAAESASMVRGVERVVSYVVVRPQNPLAASFAGQGPAPHPRRRPRRTPTPAKPPGALPCSGARPSARNRRPASDSCCLFVLFMLTRRRSGVETRDGGAGGDGGLCRRRGAPGGCAGADRRRAARLRGGGAR